MGGNKSKRGSSHEIPLQESNSKKNSSRGNKHTNRLTFQDHENEEHSKKKSKNVPRKSILKNPNLQEDEGDKSKSISEHDRKSKSERKSTSGRENEVSPRKSEVSDIKSEVSPRKSEVSPRKSEVSPRKSEVSDMKSEVSPRKSESSSRKGERKSEVSPRKREVSPRKSEVLDENSEVLPRKSEVSSRKGERKSEARKSEMSYRKSAVSDRRSIVSERSYSPERKSMSKRRSNSDDSEDDSYLAAIARNKHLDSTLMTRKKSSEGSADEDDEDENDFADTTRKASEVKTSPKKSQTDINGKRRKASEVGTSPRKSQIEATVSQNKKQSMHRHEKEAEAVVLPARQPSMYIPDNEDDINCKQRKASEVGTSPKKSQIDALISQNISPSTYEPEMKADALISQNISPSTYGPETEAVNITQEVDIKKKGKRLSMYDKRGSDWTGPCRDGKRQSPIDLESKKTVTIRRAYPLVFINYRHCKLFYCLEPTTIGLIPYPKAIQIGISAGGLRGFYKFHSAHFHWPSEHHIDNVRYSLEAHIVHHQSTFANLDEAKKHFRGIAVLAVIYKIGDPDKTITKLMKTVNGEEQKKKLKLQELLPKYTDTYFRYDGSLTTPSCEEAVVWTIFKDLRTISEEQFEWFKNVELGNGVPVPLNCRDPQKLLHRKVEYYIAAYDE